jgi:hypothetical protein
MRLKFPDIDLAFSHNKENRPIAQLGVSVKEMLKAAESMEVPTEPPRQLRKLVGIPQVGTATADRAELESEFAAQLDAIDDAAIDAARSRRSAQSTARRTAGPAPRAIESVMPLIDQQLVGRTIGYKFNTGWHNAEVLQVADGSSTYKFSRADQLCGVVPANKGFIRVHFFDDEMDLWVSCATQPAPNDGYEMFNGNRMDSWRVISN